MASHWYYANGNTKHGPLSGRDIKQLADSGELQPVDLVWKTGMADWQPAQTVSGLFPTNQSKLADPPPISTGNTSRKTRPAGVNSEECSVAKPPKHAGPEGASINSNEPHSTAKRLISSSVQAVRERVAGPQTRNVVAKFKTFCGTIWSGSLSFWIRFSAWYLGVLHRIIHANNPSNETVVTEAFPLRHVVVAEATDRAAAVPRAAFLGKVIHWTLVMPLGVGIAGSVFDPGGGKTNAKQAKEDLLETARIMEGPFARVVQV